MVRRIADQVKKLVDDETDDIDETLESEIFDAFVAKDLLISLFHTPEFPRLEADTDAVAVEQAWCHGLTDEILQHHFLPLMISSINHFVVGAKMKLGWNLKLKKLVRLEKKNLHVSPPWTWQRALLKHLFEVGKNRHETEIVKHVKKLEHHVFSLSFYALLFSFGFKAEQMRDAAQYYQERVSQLPKLLCLVI